MEADNLKDVKFNSYEDLCKFIQEYQNKHFVQLNRVFAKKLSAPCVMKKYPVKIKTVNTSLEYYNLTYKCVNGGNYKYSGSHQRKTSTLKLGCEMYLRFRLSADGQQLEMADFKTTHNHVVNEEVFHLLPKQRRLNDHEKQEAEKLIKLKCNKKMIKHFIKVNLGKTVTLKDLSNIKLNKNHFKDQNELVEALEFLKQDPEAEVELFVVDDELEGLFFQNNDMKKSFESYPEVLLCDATYKLNNLRIPLYILLVINGNGNGEVAATFLLVNETENSLTNMIQHFKEKNSAWTKTESVVTDKDLKERHVIAKELPNAQLILCLFHTLKTFRTTVTTQKMNINAAERESCLKILQKLAYSKDEQEYQTNYEKFLNLKLDKVIEYYNKNWHDIREQWVEGLKRRYLTFNTTTTNHLESFNQKIKQVVTKMSDLKSFFEDLLILLETVRDESKSKAANMAAKKIVHNYETDSVEAKYINLLTPYAFTFVEKNLKDYMIHGYDQHWITTVKDCNCNFRINMKLPCHHIFYQRSLCKLNLFDETLVNNRYKKANYIAHNTRNMRNYSDVTSNPSVSITNITSKKPVLTNNEKYRKAMALCQQLASCFSECGTLRYKKLMQQLNTFLDLTKEGKDLIVSEKTTQTEQWKEENDVVVFEDRAEGEKIRQGKELVLLENTTETEQYKERSNGVAVECTVESEPSRKRKLTVIPKDTTETEQRKELILIKDTTETEQYRHGKNDVVVKYTKTEQSRVGDEEMLLEDTVGAEQYREGEDFVVVEYIIESEQSRNQEVEIIPQLSIETKQGRRGKGVILLDNTIESNLSKEETDEMVVEYTCRINSEHSKDEKNVMTSKYRTEAEQSSKGKEVILLKDTETDQSSKGTDIIVLDNKTQAGKNPSEQRNMRLGLKTHQDVPALKDHTYCNNSLKIENVKYQHLKMKRIGRPKGVDNTVIGLKKKKQIVGKKKLLN